MKNFFVKMAVVVFLTMVMMSSVALAQYADVVVEPLNSTTYHYGVIGIKLYLNNAGVWEKQINPYNGTPTPGFDNPCWAAAEALTKSNTPTVSADGRSRFPSPWIYPASVTVAPAVNYMYYIYGRADIVALVVQAFKRGGYQYGENITTDQSINGHSGALVWSSSGAILFLPVTQASVRSGEVGRLGGMIDAFVASDTNLGQIKWNSIPLESPPG